MIRRKEEGRDGVMGSDRERDTEKGCVCLCEYG